MSKRLFTLLCAVLVALLTYAQKTNTLPLNERVITGKLSNGMTYYIMHNEEPKGRVSYYFAQNVGGILENDAQDGLAHFLEHMAFNGLEHFPGKNMLNYLEKNGIKFGREINAFTAYDETVYNINNIPTDNHNLMDSALLVLYDWSGGLLLEHEEIDAERGVIREEWRTRKDSRWRLREETNPVVFNYSKYANRDVLGDWEVINNFEYQALRDYYEKWYRPDLQAVIIVGDIDANKMEEKVIDLFSSIPAKENSPERVYYHVDEAEELGYVLATDKEAQGVSVVWYFRNKPVWVKDEAYLREEMVNYLFSNMFNNRLRELLQDPDCPAVNMQVYKFPMVRTMDVGMLYILPKQNKEREAFELLITEVEKLKRFGFTRTELERAKNSLMRLYENYEQAYEKTDNNEWAKSLYNHFLKADDVLPLEYELEFARSVASTVTLEEVAGQLKYFENVNNSAISITGPDKEEIDYPGKEELLTIVENVKHSELEAYKDEVDESPLIATELEVKNITSSDRLEGVEAVYVTLENGAKVVVYSTELHKDEILFKAFSPGGLSLVDLSDLASGEFAAGLTEASGIGELNIIQLQKKLTGKLVRVQPYISQFEEGFFGNGSAKDFETIVQLIYLYFEQPRFDKKAFDKQISEMKNQLVHKSSDNRSAMRDTITVVSSNYHPRNLLFTDEYVSNLNFSRAQDIYKDRMTDASDFTFVFVGNIDIDNHLPMIQKYIGNIHSVERQETFINHQIDPPKGVTKLAFNRPMEIPKTTVSYAIYNDIEYNLETRIRVRAIAELLSKRYLETIREEEGGSYGVAVRPEIRKIPSERASITMSFDCDPEKQERLVKIIRTEIDNLVKVGVNEDDLNEIKENYLKSREESEKLNRFWLAVINNSLKYNESIASTEEYNKLVNDLDIVNIQQFAKELFTDSDVVEIIMNPSN